MKQGFYDLENIEIKYPNTKQISPSDWVLLAGVKYISKSGDVYIIKKGFVFDGASKGLLKHFGTYTLAALLHDALYGSEAVPKSNADDLFLEAMEFLGVSYFERYLYYLSVVSFGWIVYNQHDKEEVEFNKKFVEVIHA